MSLTAVSAAWGPLYAQSQPDWRTVTQHHTWIATVVDRPLGGPWAFLGDVSWRRTGWGRSPQQLLTRGSLTYRVAQGLRVGLGLNRIATSSYGDLPLPFPTLERQAFALLQLNHRAGEFDFLHRYRYEQRWIADVRTNVAGDDSLSATRFARRARYLLRGTHAIPSVKFGGRPVLGFVSNEVFLGLSGTDRGLAFDQNRFAFGTGIPLSGTYRVDVSWMQQWIAVPRARASERNGTLVVLLNISPPAAPKR